MTAPFWSNKWGRDHICPITQSRLRPGHNADGIPHVITLKCSHRFYRKALYEWFITSKTTTCPVCRQCVVCRITCE